MAMLVVLLVYVISIFEAGRALYEKKASIKQWMLLALLNIAVFALAYWNIRGGIQADANHTVAGGPGLIIFGILGLATFVYNAYLFLSDDKPKAKKGA